MDQGYHVILMMAASMTDILIQKRKFKHRDRHAQKEDDMKTQRQCHLQAMEWGLGTGPTVQSSEGTNPDDNLNLDFPPLEL